MADDIIYKNKKLIFGFSVEFNGLSEEVDGTCGTWNLICSKFMGYSIANAYRRMLMTFSDGEAIVAVKISGANSPFDVLHGVKQSVQEIITNLAGIKFASDNSNFSSCTLHLNKQESKSEINITASSFSTTGTDIQILNPHHLICNAIEVPVNISIFVVKSNGYLSSEEHVIENLPDGWFPVDSCFNPIVNVNYTVSDHFPDKDVVVLKITSASGGLEKLFQVATNNLSLLFGRPVIEDGSNDFDDFDQYDVLLDRPVEALEGLTFRALNAFGRAKIETIRELVKHSRKDLLKIDNIGEETVNNVETCLREKNLSLAPGDRRNE